MSTYLKRFIECDSCGATIASHTMTLDTLPAGWSSIPPDNDGYGSARHACDEEECREWLRRFAHLHGVEV